MSIIEEARKVLLKYPLCDHCLGRLFASRGFMISNEERGKSIKNVLFMEALNSAAGTYDEGILAALAKSGHRESLLFLRRMGKAIEPQPCFICGNLFDRINIDDIINKVKGIINEQGIEFSSFQVGSTVNRGIIENEVKVSTELGITSSESIKRELNRLIGKALANKLGKRYSRLNPDVVVRVNTSDGSVSVEAMPIYIEARYRKLLRGIPQIGESSVASVAKEAVSELRPLNVVLHFAGVEGPEVRVLGLGRPMIIEATRPLRRSILEGTVTRHGVQLLNLKAAGKVQVREIKSKAGELRRVYRILAKLYGGVSDEQLRSLEDYFSNRQIRQSMGKGRRVKLIYSLRVIPVYGSVLELIVDTQGGFSIRRFITGEGTEPSVSGTLGVKVIPIEVDVLNIWY
ncbi:tRNA pseudouridine(54/55) synthase Pus10 [Caldivirga sp. UBA161]|uniref:tRNA pseudouridine(54/55) synthase Pus10 n=1 Tax=Caldivirga sp. UBA161 TaxID=1915569 RepID=UPI0025BE266E|nr:tRNA pseudouridine(54/55) synthase Pus10 [Caldivirga sp. UBA161]